jgi:tRNA(fMet)-specific endonuclease VapC
VSDVLAALEREHGQTEVVLSVVTVVELEHGLHRAHTPEIAQRRRDYLNSVFAAIPLEAFTKEMAQVAARVDAETRRAGKVVPFQDLLIGVTAMHFDYHVGTRNPRHFEMIPGLSVVKM